MTFRLYAYNPTSRPDGHRDHAPALDSLVLRGREHGEADNHSKQLTSILIEAKGGDYGSFIPRSDRLAACGRNVSRDIRTDRLFPFIGAIRLNQSTAPGSGLGRQQHCRRLRETDTGGILAVPGECSRIELRNRNPVGDRTLSRIRHRTGCGERRETMRGRESFAPGSDQISSALVPLSFRLAVPFVFRGQCYDMGAGKARKCGLTGKNIRFCSGHSVSAIGSLSPSVPLYLSLHHGISSVRSEPRNLTKAAPTLTFGQSANKFERLAS